MLFSQHSSNPLEARSSSDARHLRRVQRHPNAHLPSSDDPINGFSVPAYHTHLTTVIPDYTIPLRQRPDMDEDENMESDDESEPMDQEAQSDGDGDQEEEDESDEETSIMKKSPEERHEIREEIAELERAVPEIGENYKLVDRLGTGTFSSVYKALDLGYHDKWDNTPWLGSHPPSSSAHYLSVPRPLGSKVFVAIKRIYVTSNPERIRNEIAILADCRGCRHVSQLITAFRNQDQVVVVIPYHRNDDFREYYQTLPMAGIKAYLRCMFRALRDIHARKIIHRDVKPANFLFDPRTGQGSLCDFGLACRLEGPTQSHGACFHTSASPEHPHGRVASRNVFAPDKIKERQKEARIKSSAQSDKVGYPANETRPVSKANRAGTRGFRAPEVLLKCADQTGAIDVWAVGTILLFFLTGKFPLFQCSDDHEALMEIAVILGKKKMEKTAVLHSRTFATNVPTVTESGTSWTSFVNKLNPDLQTPPKPDPAYYPYSNTNSMGDDTLSAPPASSSSPSRSSSPVSSTSNGQPTEESPAVAAHRHDVELAFSLLQGLMEPEAYKRTTPKDALAHEFLLEMDEPADDEMFPHPFGEGACHTYHFVDEVTEESYVRVYEPRRPGQSVPRLGMKRVVPGEGMAIGRQPCEFHTDTTLYSVL
ncbi:kinase-like protein [Roridomyces roridus]|uniref:non-specific serine/threonine protein kinase n=1 Tax=Roridomyces roridus TaxID=1738132 RepID=A0AAD7FNR0_9AGAR|nr:kinase-like protein [Roridomyces roridus]